MTSKDLEQRSPAPLSAEAERFLSQIVARILANLNLVAQEIDLAQGHEGLDMLMPSEATVVREGLAALHDLLAGASVELQTAAIREVLATYFPEYRTGGADEAGV